MQVTEFILNLTGIATIKSILCVKLDIYNQIDHPHFKKITIFKHSHQISNAITQIMKAYLNKKSPLALILNIVTALFLLSQMPQHILIYQDAEILKIISVILVDICAIAILIYSLYRLIFDRIKS